MVAQLAKPFDTQSGPHGITGSEDDPIRRAPHCLGLDQFSRLLLKDPISDLNQRVPAPCVTQQIEQLVDLRSSNVIGCR